MATLSFGPPPAGAQQASPEQIQAIQRQIEAEAQKQGISVQQFMERMRAQAMAQHQAQLRAQGQGQGQSPGQGQGQGQTQGQHQHDHQHQHQQSSPQQMQAVQKHVNPNQPGPPNPAAIALAKFFKSQELKTRTCIYQEKRKDLFRVKRALRVLQTPAYEKARKKNPLLPEVNDRASAENAFKLLPLSLLALRVSKVDPHAGHEGHGHGPKKRVKGLWTVRIEQHQNTDDDDHYMWLYEGSQWRQKVYAVLALLAVFAVVLFPLWPLVVRQGVWYISVGFLGLIGLFFAMAIVRLILFCITVMALPRGFWLYPNLFEDVGFFDSFRPVWAWQEDKNSKKAAKAAKKAEKAAKENGKFSKSKPKSKAGDAASEKSVPIPESKGEVTTTSATPTKATGTTQSRKMQASVEEANE